ncbi:MAG TPA: DUF1697 domain-containing protein [Tepidisphaeraceae bacterium]|jgi:uncharacterized protein (DUF1697 family)
MPRYAAFLRGVMPTNAKMPQLRAAFEAAGCADVRTVISSGNVIFTAARAPESSLQRKAEAAMMKKLGRDFLTIVRPIDALRELLASDPFQQFDLVPKSKRIVTFLRDKPAAKIALPVELHGAQILAIEGREIFTAYVPHPKGAIFMGLIESTFGKALTTRTWDTVAKVAR